MASSRAAPPQRPRIIFVNRFFYPDYSATSQLLGDLAFHLADEGRNVHVIASRGMYETPAAKLARRESVCGVTIHRVTTTSFGRAGSVGRALDYLSFHLAAAWRAWRIVRRGDVLVAKTDPPMLSVTMSFVARLRRARLVNWLQDLYPEIATALGFGRSNGMTARFLLLLRNGSLRHAAANVTIGTDMARRLALIGPDIAPISVITNWADDETIVPQSADNGLRAAWGLDGKFVIGYSGNLGRAHDAVTVLEAAARLSSSDNIRFLFIGAGAGMGAVEGAAVEGRIHNMCFRPYQPRERLSESLAVSDVHWLSLKPGFEGLVFPSKFYGIAACGRPMLVVAARNSELACLVEDHDCGLVIAPGDAAGMVQAITMLHSDAARRAAMGQNARRMAVTRFSKKASLASWLKVLHEAGVPDPAELRRSVQVSNRPPAQSTRVPPRRL